jgi:hypothetical protein
MSRASGQASGVPPVHWHRHRSHGAHVAAWSWVRCSKQPAAYARKVLLNRRLLERPSPGGLPGRRAVSSQLEPHAGPILTGK